MACRDIPYGNPENHRPRLVDGAQVRLIRKVGRFAGVGYYRRETTDRGVIHWIETEDRERGFSVALEDLELVE